MADIAAVGATAAECAGIEARSPAETALIAAHARTAGKGERREHEQAQRGMRGFRCRFHYASVDCYFGAILSQHDAHLSEPHLSQQSPPCVQQEAQSLLAFIFGWVPCATSTGRTAKANAIRVSFSVVFMVVVFC